MAFLNDSRIERSEYQKKKNFWSDEISAIQNQEEIMFAVCFLQKNIVISADYQKLLLPKLSRSPWSFFNEPR